MPTVPGIDNATPREHHMHRPTTTTRLFSLCLSVFITASILFGLDGLATSAPSDMLVARTAVSAKA